MQNVATKILNIFYPPHCIFCDGLMHYSTLYCVCEDCKGKLPPSANRQCHECGSIIDVSHGKYTCAHCGEDHTNYLINARYYQFSGIVRDCVLRLKFNNCTDYAETMALIMVAHLIENGYTVDDFNVIVPMPIAPKRLKKRGYNHAELLARNIAKVLELPIDTKTLIRPLDAPPQSTLSAKERQENLKGKFKVDNQTELAGKRVLLVDDVYTTGATMNAATDELMKNANTKTVHGIVFALTY